MVLEEVSGYQRYQLHPGQVENSEVGANPKEELKVQELQLEQYY